MFSRHASLENFKMVFWQIEALASPNVAGSGDPALQRMSCRLRYRSAGACPPRSLNRCGKRPQPRDHGWLLRRPAHGEGQALALREGEAFFCHRSAGACPPRSLAYPNDGEGNPLACACGIRGPKPYVKGAAFFSPHRGVCLHLPEGISLP